MSFVLMLTFPSVLSSVIWIKIDRFHPFCSYISFVGVKTLTALSVTFWPRLSSLMFGHSLLICSNFDYFKFLNLLDFILPKKSVKKKWIYCYNSEVINKFCSRLIVFPMCSSIFHVWLFSFVFFWSFEFSIQPKLFSSR